MTTIMNKNILKGIVLVGAALATIACSKEYLETAPESSTSPATIFETTDNAELAVTGLARMMTMQYLSTQGFNGEGTIKTWYGNYPGNDFQKCNLTGWSSIINGTYHERATASYDYYPWYYYFKIIGNANQIITKIDDAEGAESDKAFLKAQALVFRAYSFFMMSQLYCDRWMDSNNGASAGLPLRVDTSVGDIALSTLGETYAQIYADLDEALKLFASTTRDRKYFYEANADVAHAVYARAALTRQDWANAASHAASARNGYKLMSSKDYAAGFNTPNDEWIWGVYESEDQTLYYYSFFAYQGSNSSASICRSYPCAISKELIDQIPDADTRRYLYLIPTDAEVKDSKFTQSNGRSTGILYNRAFKEYGSMLYSTSYVFQYMQFKLRASFMPGGGSFNLFRAAEMYYIEAEAQCMLGNDAAAQKLLAEVNKAHNSSYSCSLKGADLLKEVKLYRRFDLWGEGFDWFDYKRWGEPINRKSIANGGSFHATFAIKVDPKAENNWNWIIPQKESDYNDLIN